MRFRGETRMHIISGIMGGYGGIYALTIATEGWMFQRVGILTRIVMVPCAFMLFHTAILTDLAGWLQPWRFSDFFACGSSLSRLSKR